MSIQKTVELIVGLWCRTSRGFSVFEGMCSSTSLAWESAGFVVKDNQFLMYSYNIEFVFKNSTWDEENPYILNVNI